MRQDLVKFFRFFLVAFGAFLGLKGSTLALEQDWMTEMANPYYMQAASVGFGGLVGLVVGPSVIRGFQCSMTRLVATLNKAPTAEVMSGAVGLIVGLIIAILISIPIPNEIPMIGEYLPLGITLVFGYIGLVVGLRKKEELLNVFGRGGAPIAPSVPTEGSTPKILDTSVIIDGRIADITKSGFLEGVMVVPGFVLEELQHIADSSDVLKRNRGRRGLDILNKIQKEPYVAVEILDKDYDEVSEVDSKLVRLAKDMAGKVVTNDYNLNKVCELQGVAVLNINELANAVKPVVLPGEELQVHVIKDGKEHGQGVAYLDDGTMIVVDGGRRFIGETIGVLVTSVLQTAAGRMIFAKPKAMEKAL